MIRFWTLAASAGFTCACLAMPTQASDCTVVRFFPFSRCVGFYGELAPSCVAICHRLAIGLDAEALQRVEHAFFAAASDIVLFKQNKPGNIARISSQKCKRQYRCLFCQWRCLR